MRVDDGIVEDDNVNVNPNDKPGGGDNPGGGGGDDDGSDED